MIAISGSPNSRWRRALSLAAMMLCLSGLAAAKPNILWIIFEDMSPDWSCYGNQAIETPNLDALAARGMRFTNLHVTNPACSPSRTALATGVYQTTLGAYHMRYSEALKPVLPSPYKILPELMREQGYLTGNVKSFPGLKPGGKDDWLFKTAQQSWDTRDWAKLSAQQPFFAQVQFKESHRSFRRTLPNEQKAKISIPPYYPDHPVTRDDFAGYLADVVATDGFVGTILKQLQKQNLADNTIIFVFSDHGRPMTRGKNWLYDSGTNIPLIVYCPPGVTAPKSYRPGAVDQQLLSAVDLTAESLAMTGAAVPGWMQGRAFLSGGSQPRDRIFTAADRFGNIDSGSRAVRTGRFKYIRNHKRPASIVEASTYYRRAKHPIYHLMHVLNDRNQLTPVQEQLLAPMPAEELYDLQNDPFEINNLVGKTEYQGQLRELRASLDDWIKTSKDLGFRPDPPEIVEHFRKYGEVNKKKLAKAIAAQRAAVEKQVK